MESADSSPTVGRGRIVVISGCMFAGKTARLIAHLHVAHDAGRRVFACKHCLDTRYDTAELRTHDGRRFPAHPVASAGEIAISAGDAEVVGIDEAQFFGRALLEVCRALAAEGRDVVVAGIDHDAWGQPFPPLPQLKELADAVEPQYAPCTVCGRPAEYSQRVTPVRAGDMVGGPADYKPRCEQCFQPLPGPAPVYA